MKPICLLPVAPHFLNSDVDPDSCEYVLAYYGTDPAMVHIAADRAPAPAPPSQVVPYRYRRPDPPPLPAWPPKTPRLHRWQPVPRYGDRGQ